MRILKFIALAMILGLVPLLQSCMDSDNDNDSAGLAMATVKVIEGNEYYLSLNDGAKMYPGDTTAIHNYELQDGQRAFIYFNLLDDKVSGYDYNAQIVNIVNILTKEIVPLTEETAEAIGDDPINLTGAWMTKDNVTFEFQILGTNSAEKKHFLNLVQNETESAATDEDGYINLEFRHNNEGDSPLQVGAGYVAFKLDAIAPLMDGKKGIKIRVNSIYDGIKYYKVNFMTANQTFSMNRSVTSTYTTQTIY